MTATEAVAGQSGGQWSLSIMLDISDMLLWCCVGYHDDYGAHVGGACSQVQIITW